MSSTRAAVRSRRPRWGRRDPARPLVTLLAVALLGAGACKLEPIEDYTLPETSTWHLPPYVIPLSTQLPTSDLRNQRWDAALQRNLGFLTGSELQGRRPGTRGAELTSGFVISMFERADLSPNGPDLGWTQPVGVRVVQTTTQSMTIQTGPVVQPDGSITTPAPLRFEEGLWLRHRGKAGTHALMLRLDDPDASLPPLSEGVPPPPLPVAPPGERLLAPPLPEMPPPPDDGQPSPAAATQAFRSVFDTAWRDGMSVAVLPIPVDDPLALEVAEGWRDPDVQSLLLGRDPPAALDLEGFVQPTIHVELTAAAAIPGSVATIEFQTDERWFEDDNVIGRLAGHRRPEQAVVVIASWDAGGLGEPLPEGGDVPAAAGITALLSMAENAGMWRDAGRRPERSLVFVAAAAGSLGHRGIQRFIEASGIRPSNIVAVINLEHLGGAESGLLIVDGDRSTLSDRVRLLDPSARSVPSDGVRFGHTAFLEQKIPAITLSRPGARGQGDDDATEDAELSLATLRTDADLTFRLLWDLADRPEIPRLVEGAPEAPAPP